MNNTTKTGKTERYEIRRIADQGEKERIVAGLANGGGTEFAYLDPRTIATCSDAIFVAYANGEPVGFAGLSYRSDPSIRTGGSASGSGTETGRLGFTFLGQVDGRTALYARLFKERVEDCIYRWL